MANEPTPSWCGALVGAGRLSSNRLSCPRPCRIAPTQGSLSRTYRATDTPIRDFLLNIGTTAGIVIVVLVAIRLRLGRGLGTRIFLLVTPAMGALVIRSTTSNFFQFDFGSVADILTNGVGTAIGVGALIYLYRSVVQELTARLSGLHAGTAQLAVTAKQAAATTSQQATMVAEVSSTIEETRQTNR
jgi:methyl-accepting chemotaxis protein